MAYNQSSWKDNDKRLLFEIQIDEIEPFEFHIKMNFEEQLGAVWRGQIL